VPEDDRPSPARDAGGAGGPRGAGARDLAALLARAFHDDPLMNWVVPDATRRPAFLRALFAANLRSARHCGRVDADPGNGGAALWLAPGRFPLSRARLLASGHLWLPLRLPLTGSRRLGRANRYALMLHRRTAQGRHWYLHGLGVEPARQRRGIGEALLVAGLERADAERMPCYLETAVESTLDLYERHGFRIEIRGRVPPDGPPVWAMLRPAKRGPL
jgi:ribosomal protein S18 acetylase RimI-like enzyme